MSDQPEQPDQAPAPAKKKRMSRKPVGRKRVRHGTAGKMRTFWAPDELLADFMQIAHAINKRGLKSQTRRRISLNTLYVEALTDWAKRAKKRLKLSDE